jgi:hypothetical protein
MKSLRFMLPIVLVALSAVALAQSDPQKSGAQMDHSQKPAAPKTEAQKSFDELKTLAGGWQGPLTVDPPQPEMENGQPLGVSLRVTSRGHALVHEMQEANTPLDPTKYDHPVTMMYVDGDRLNLVHYCDAGNRPHMIAKVSPDGRKVEFDFADLSGGTQYGHMHHAVFTVIDANHHTEDWTYMMPGDKPVHAHFDLQRAK